METLKDIIVFFIKRKKFFLIPIVVFLAAFGLLLALSSGSTLSPFIYAIF
jgi:hypothetical protein